REREIPHPDAGVAQHEQVHQVALVALALDRLECGDLLSVFRLAGTSGTHCPRGTPLRAPVGSSATCLVALAQRQNVGRASKRRLRVAAWRYWMVRRSALSSTTSVELRARAESGSPVASRKQ